MRLFPLLLLAGLTLVGCSGPAEMVEPPTPLTELKPALKVSRAWIAQVGTGTGRQFLVQPPLISEGRVFATSRKGDVVALAASDGKVLWRRDLGPGIGTGPGEGGALLLLGVDNEVVALDKDSGETLWHVPLSSEVIVAPVRAGNTVVARTVDGGIYGLTASDGTALWHDQRPVPALSLRGQAPILVSNDFALVGFANGRVIAYALDDGRAVWEAVLSTARGRNELERMADVDAQLAVAEGVVFAAGFHGRIGAYTLGTGRNVWSRDFSSYSGVAAADRDLYATDADGRVFALSQSNGGTLWRQEALLHRHLTAPAVQGNAVVVGDLEGWVHWLDRSDGHLLARMRVEEPLFDFPLRGEDEPQLGYRETRPLLAPPVVAGEYLFAIDQRGALNAFRVTATEAR